MKQQPIGDRVSDLRFNLRISMRYCQKLRRFWGGLQLLTETATFFGASIAVALLIVPEVPNVGLASGLAMAAVAASAFSLLLKPERRASEWHRFAEEHNRVLGNLDDIDGDEQPSEYDLTQLEKRKRLIDVQEGPALRVLAAMCFNEEVTARALGDRYRIKVGPIQRILSRVADVGGQKLKDPWSAQEPDLKESRPDS